MDSHTGLGLACLLIAWLHLHSYSPAQEALMALRFLGKDDTSPNGDSPSIWDDGDTYVLQGWRVSDPDAVAELLQAAGRDHVPDHETLIRFPKRMMHMFPEVSSGR